MGGGNENKRKRNKYTPTKPNPAKKAERRESSSGSSGSSFSDCEMSSSAQDQMDKLREKVDDGQAPNWGAKGPTSLTDISKLILISHDSIQEGLATKFQEVERKMDDIYAILNEHEKRFKELEDRQRALEAREVRNNLLLLNLEMHPNTKNNVETREQTEEQVQNFLCKLKLDGKVKNFGCRRFRQRDPDKARGPPMVHLRCQEGYHKGMIFGALAREKTGGRVSVVNEFPLSLKNEHKRLEEEAKKIRENSNKSTKTRIEMNFNNSLVLKIKEKGEASFKIITV